MRLCVISLPSRADRRAQFSTWNARSGLDLDFAPAAIGAELDRAALVADRVLAADSVAAFSAGALGNAVSHRRLWERARESAAPVWICEDDACLRGDFTVQAPALLASLDAWDIVFFGYNTNALVAVEGPEGIKALLHFDEAAKRAPGFFGRFAGLHAAPPALLACYQVWGTLSYAVSPAGAARLLSMCFPLSAAQPLVMFGQNRSIKPYTLDGMINQALQRDSLRAYCAFPPLALSANSAADSDVVGGR